MYWTLAFHRCGIPFSTWHRAHAIYIEHREIPDAENLLIDSQPHRTTTLNSLKSTHSFTLPLPAKKADKSRGIQFEISIYGWILMRLPIRLCYSFGMLNNRQL